MGNPILEIKNLNKVYHDLSGEILAIDSLSLAVKEKEFIAIVGPSGCGKSTLLSILAGLEKKSGGSIKLHNDCKLGYMLQDDSLFPWLTILDNCLLGLQIKKKIDNQSKEQVIRLLKTYGLEEFMDKYPKSLSGGMRQRVVRRNKPTTILFQFFLDLDIDNLEYYLY
jgi:NitT/TauT family transport system ATP-binding protein